MDLCLAGRHAISWSPVRFRPKTRHFRFTWIWAYRPSIKGSKLLFPVIKATKINVLVSRCIAALKQANELPQYLPLISWCNAYRRINPHHAHELDCYQAIMTFHIHIVYIYTYMCFHELCAFESFADGHVGTVRQWSATCTSNQTQIKFISCHCHDPFSDPYQFTNIAT